MSQDDGTRLQRAIAEEFASLREQGVIVLTMRALPEGRVEVRYNSERTDADELLVQRYGVLVEPRRASTQNRFAGE